MTQETNVTKILESCKEAEEFYNSIPEELKTLADISKKRTKQEKDLVIVVTAHEEGAGKSSFAILFGWLVNMLGFDLIKNMCYIANADKIKKQFWEIEEGGVFVVDEAIKALYKMDFANSLQKMLVQMYATERWQQKISILCIPRITDLSENFRGHKVKIWIKIMKRGYAVVHLRDPDNIYDPWYLEWEKKYLMSKWASKKVSEVGFAERIKLERAKRTYLMEFEIPKLPNKLFRIYEDIKKAMHKEDAEAVDTPKETAELKRWKDTTFNAIKFIKQENPKISQAKLGEILGISDKTIRSFCLGYDEGFFEKEKKVKEDIPEYLQKIMEAREAKETNSISEPKEQ